jgi:excisionase family DNA binding protein
MSGRAFASPGPLGCPLEPPTLQGALEAGRVKRQRDLVAELDALRRRVAELERRATGVEPRELPVAEAARQLGVDRSTVWRQVRRGVLRVTRRVGRKTYVLMPRVSA